MKKFLLYILCVGLPIFISLPILNYVFDPYHVFSTKYADKAVEILKQGHNVTNVNMSNYATRIFRERFIPIHKNEHFDYLILGSSQTMQFSNEMFGGKRVLNVGVLSCTLLDAVALYEICTENNITADNIIIHPTLYYYNANSEEKYWMRYQDYLNRYLGENKSYIFTGNIPMLFDASIITKLLKQDDLKATDLRTEPSTYCTDGSMAFGISKKKKPQALIDALAQNMHTVKGEKGKYHAIGEISKEYVCILEKFIKDCRKSNINLVMVKMPYHPLQYEAFMKIPGIPEQALATDSIAKANGIEIYGSYNPMELGYKNTDFYDGTHAKKNVGADIVKMLLGRN